MYFGVSAVEHDGDDEAQHSSLRRLGYNTCFASFGAVSARVSSLGPTSVNDPVSLVLEVLGLALGSSLQHRYRPIEKGVRGEELCLRSQTSDSLTQLRFIASLEIPT
jgi:hypothetical protein